MAVATVLPARSALTDKRGPTREHWRWLMTLFH